MKESIKLIKDLFELHKLLADVGEVSIGLGFSESYNKLEERVNTLIKEYENKNCSCKTPKAILDIKQCHSCYKDIEKSKHKSLIKKRLKGISEVVNKNKNEKQ